MNFKRFKISVRDAKKPLYLGERIRGFLDLMRPFSLIGAFIAGFFLVWLVSLYYQQPFNLFLAVIVGICLTLLQSGGQILNQSLGEEISIDLLSGKGEYRPIPRGIIKPIEGKIFSILLFSVGNLIAWILNPLFGLSTIIITFFAVFYSTYPLRVKKRFFLNNLWQGISRGGLPILAVWTLYGNPFSTFPLALALIGSTWVTPFQSTKDFNEKEIEADRQFGVKTLPVVLGRGGTLCVMYVGLIFFLFLLGYFICSGILPKTFILLSFALGLFSVLIIISLIEGYRISYLENNLAWGLFYGGLSTFYILPPILLSMG